MYIRLCYLWQQPRVRKVVREFAFWEGRDVTVMSLHGRENSVLERLYDSRIPRLELANFLRDFPLHVHEKEQRRVHWRSLCYKKTEILILVNYSQIGNMSHPM